MRTSQAGEPCVLICILEKELGRPSGPQIRRERAGGKKTIVTLQNIQVDQEHGRGMEGRAPI